MHGFQSGGLKKCLKLPIPDLPVWLELEAMIDGKAADAILKDIKITAIPDRLRGKKEFQVLLDGLRHPLSGMAEQRVARQTSGQRTEEEKNIAEHDVCGAFYGPFKEVLNGARGPLDFIELLQDINSRLRVRPTTIRSKSVFSTADLHGHFWQYPDHRTIPQQLERLYFFLQQEKNAPGLFVGAACITFLNCLHPFEDGNGRTARVFFNLVMMNSGLPPDSYIPCKELFSASGRSFLIQLRYTSLTGDWMPMMDFLTEILRLCSYCSRHGALLI